MVKRGNNASLNEETQISSNASYKTPHPSLLKREMRIYHQQTQKMLL